ncbi:MAG TPA: SDR family NAD(P)-dependent oxidoreductase, partial [Pyrinomonadaceae bacterium]
MSPRPEFLAPKYRGAGKLLDKVALITGGDSGIGRSVAVLYAREGANVAIVYLKEEEVDARETAMHIEA